MARRAWSLRSARLSVAAVLGLIVATGAGAVASSASAQSYVVRVTCSVPIFQPQRQLAPNSCLNYLPDGTQTYVAHVKDSNGNPVQGVTVKWTDSDSNDANFRLANNPCTTGSNGTCQDELVDSHPRAGEKITVTATAGGTTAKGYLTFAL
jgi:hypothetical protein